jgi:hypothetical protein
MAMTIRSARILAVFAAVAGTSSTRAQMAMPGSGRSLGGYGASAITSYYGGGSPAYVPYSGNAHGFVPYRGASGGGLEVQPITRRLAQTPIGGTMMADTAIGGASLSGGMGIGGGRRSGTGMSARPGRGSILPFGYEGGAGTGGMAATPGGMGARRTSTGPGFGYPFRMPPSLGGGSAMGMP